MKLGQRPSQPLLQRCNEPLDGGLAAAALVMVLMTCLHCHHC
jgi:hypothetical protein